MRFIIVDLKRCFTERSFITSIFIGIACVAVSMILMINQGGGSIKDLFISSHSLILPFIAPLLAALPYSNMNMVEADNKYDLLIMLRQNGKGWEFKRFFTNGVVSGLCIVIPLLLLLIACLVMGLDNSINEILSVILLDFIFGFAFASISYGLTFVNTKKYIPIVAPQVIYLLLIYAFPYLGLEAYYPPLCFSPWILPSYANLRNINTIFIVVIGLSIVLVFMGKFKRKIINTISLGGKK